MKWALPLGAFSLFLAALIAKNRLVLARPLGLFPHNQRCLNVRGKALFLRNIRDFGRGELAAKEYRRLGFSWAIIPWLWARDGRRPNRDPLFYAELHRLGIPFVFMVWPTPGNWRAELLETIEGARQMGATGILLDVEVARRWPFDTAEQMAKFAKDECHRHGLKVGLTSLGSAQFHRAFPYRAFAPYMDFGIPQLYDRQLTLNQSYFKNGFDAWIDNGFRCLILAVSEFERTTGRNRAKSPSTMRNYLGVAKAALQPSTAILWEHFPINEQFRNWRL